jgi:hypothetical protein
LPRVFGADLGGLLILALYGFVHLATVHRNLARRFDSQPHFVATHVDDRYDDVIANDDTFVALAGEDEHDTSMIGYPPGALYKVAPCLQHNGCAECRCR